MKPKMKIAQEFPRKDKINIGQELAKQIRKILRRKYEDLPSAIKRIQLETGVHGRAIRNWYEGRNPPSATHLVVLIRVYPAILRMFLSLVGHSYLVADIYERNVPENVPDEFAIDCLNERQKWILFRLALNHKILPRDIARVWPVTERTAKRDLADLKFRGYILHAGSTKTGRYVLRR